MTITGKLGEVEGVTSTSGPRQETSDSNITKSDQSYASSDTSQKERSFADSEDAKETIVWFIVKFILIMCGCITAVIVFADVIINKHNIKSAGTLILDVKSLWETFSSIITLALGYLFGKEVASKKKE